MASDDAVAKGMADDQADLDNAMAAKAAADEVSKSANADAM